jgi:hypothetical protein
MDWNGLAAPEPSTIVDAGQSSAFYLTISLICTCGTRSV